MKPSLFKLQLAFWMLVFLTLAAVYYWKKSQPAIVYHEGSGLKLEKDKGMSLEDFALTERSGEPFQASDLDGKVWVASFFFSSCPGPCLSLNQKIEYLSDQFKDLPVTFVSISVDPENDTPALLTQYAERFQADPERWLFLTGDSKAVQKVATDGFKVAANVSGVKSVDDHEITHSERLFVVDKNRQIRGYFSFRNDLELVALKRQVESLLKEPYTPKEVPVLRVEEKTEVKQESSSDLETE